jgi:hypothetical protein
LYHEHNNLFTQRSHSSSSSKSNSSSSSSNFVLLLLSSASSAAVFAVNIDQRLVGNSERKKELDFFQEESSNDLQFPITILLFSTIAFGKERLRLLRMLSWSAKSLSAC